MKKADVLPIKEYAYTMDLLSLKVCGTLFTHSRHTDKVRGHGANDVAMQFDTLGEQTRGVVILKKARNKIVMCFRIVGSCCSKKKKTGQKE